MGWCAEKHPGLYSQQRKAAQFRFRGGGGGGRGRGRRYTARIGEGPRRKGRRRQWRRIRNRGRREGASERERRQFFKIKAVKPNLQVCRRKRVEVVKILVCCIRARNPLLSPRFSVPLFRSCFSTHPSCAFRATSSASRPWPPLPVVKLPHETFLMSNRGDLRLSFLPSFSLLLSPLPPHSPFAPHNYFSFSQSIRRSFSRFVLLRTFLLPSPSVPPSVCFPRVAFPSFVFPRYSHRPTPSRTRERPRWSPRRSPSCAKEAPNVGLRAAATQ